MPSLVRVYLPPIVRDGVFVRYGCVLLLPADVARATSATIQGVKAPEVSAEVRPGS